MTQATVETTTPPPAPDKRSRLTVRHLIVVGVAFAVVAASSIGVLRFLADHSATNTALEPLTVTDRNKIVAIDLPAGWEDTTASDAGQISTEGDSGDTVPPYRVPDISARRDFADNNLLSGSWLRVAIEPTVAAGSERERHVAHVREVSADYDKDATFTAPVSIPDISGHPALRSSGKVAGSSSDLFVITIRTPTHLITVDGDTALHREPGWDNLPTDPRREELAQQVTGARIS